MTPADNPTRARIEISQEPDGALTVEFSSNNVTDKGAEVNLFACWLATQWDDIIKRYREMKTIAAAAERQEAAQAEAAAAAAEHQGLHLVSSQPKILGADGRPATRSEEAPTPFPTIVPPPAPASGPVYTAPEPSCSRSYDSDSDSSSYSSSDSYSSACD